MKLEAEAPVLSITLDALSKIVAGALERKRWHRFTTGTVKLIYFPLYVFNYQVFMESEGRIVNEESGKVAIRATDGELMPYVPVVLNEMPLELVRETRHDYEAEVREFELTREEAKEMVRIKMASMLGVGKENVNVFGGKKMYWPIWRVWVEVREGNFRLDVDGVTGEIWGVEKVPERELGWYEITEQVLTELRTPKGWVKYVNALASVLGVHPIVVWLILFALLMFFVGSILGWFG